MKFEINLPYAHINLEYPDGETTCRDVVKVSGIDTHDLSVALGMVLHENYEREGNINGDK